MGKKRGLFSFFKRLFNPQTTKPKIEQKSKKWGWVFGRLKFKQYPEIGAPPQNTLSEATEEQRKHVLAVAIATAAAAEAAVAAANAAAEVVKLTNLPHEIQRRRRRNLAATKIQSAYRRHLAMKALSALKGLVKLQAVIRGEILRRKVMLKMKFKPILSVKAEPQVCRIRLPVMEKDLAKDEWRRKFSPESEEIRGAVVYGWVHNLPTDHILDEQLIDSQNMRWDFSLASKEDMEAMWFRKQEAMIKRERMKKYSYSHRERRNDQTLDEWMAKESGRKSCQISRWKEVENQERIEKERPKSSAISAIHPNNFAGETDKMRQLKLISYTSKQDMKEALNSPSLMPRRSSYLAKQNSNGEPEVSERREMERPKSGLGSNSFADDARKNMRQLKLISNAYKQDSRESLNSPFLLSRRSSLDPKQKFIGEDFSLPNSPSFPTYMTVTESAKAKIRSISTPKQRFLLSESFSGHHSPCSIRISPRNSSDGEEANSSRKSGISQPLNYNSIGSQW